MEEHRSPGSLSSSTREQMHIEGGSVRGGGAAAAVTCATDAALAMVLVTPVATDRPVPTTLCAMVAFAAPSCEAPSTGLVLAEFGRGTLGAAPTEPIPPSAPPLPLLLPAGLRVPEAMAAVRAAVVGEMDDDDEYDAGFEGGAARCKCCNSCLCAAAIEVARFDCHCAEHRALHVPPGYIASIGARQHAHVLGMEPAATL